MSLLTGIALKRRSVTLLMIVLILVGGVLVYGRMERELFPEIEFPNITILTVYPSANPDAVVRDVTAQRGQVIATGGGVVLSSANVAALRTDGCVVHLVASPETIHARLTADDGRKRPPLTAAGGDLSEVRQLWEQRESAYRQARHQMVSAEDMSVQAVAAAVLAEYRRFAQDAHPGTKT